MKSLLSSALFVVLIAASAQAQTPFADFEARQVHPVCLTPDGTRLVAVHSETASVSVFDVSNTAAAPSRLAQIPVGLAPVTVRALNNDEIWVVNEVSDSISIISLSARAVVATLDAGDEPADVVFANGKAFITCARSNSIEVRDLSTHALLTSIPLQGRFSALRQSDHGAVQG